MPVIRTPGALAPLRYMDAGEVLRRRIPEVSQRDAGRNALYSGSTVSSIPVGQTVQLAALASPDEPKLYSVEAAAQFLGAGIPGARVYFEVRWSFGKEMPTVRFTQSDPFTVLATAMTLLAVNPTGFVATPWIISGVIGLPAAPMPRPGRPLWSDPANVAVPIAFGASTTFVLGPFTRRIRVGRQNGATPFTVVDPLGSTVQVIAANGEFPWREIVGPTVSVINNAAAGSDNFTLYEELGL